MRILLILLSFAFLAPIYTQAQVITGSMDRLNDMYIFEKYGDCYLKAIKLTESEKYRTDPEPYLYIAMCLIKINESEELKEDFDGDPLKDALKYATKAKKYHAKREKKGIETFDMSENLEFYEELNLVALEEIIYHYNEDKFSKAASWGKKLAKVDPESSEIQVLVGANMLLSLNAEGQKLVDMYWPKLVEKYKGGDEVPAEHIKPAVVYGILALSKYYHQKGQSVKAKEVIQFGKDLFVDNNKINAAYEEINS